MNFNFCFYYFLNFILFIYLPRARRPQTRRACRRDTFKDPNSALMLSPRLLKALLLVINHLFICFLWVQNGIPQVFLSIVLFCCIVKMFTQKCQNTKLITQDPTLEIVLLASIMSCLVKFIGSRPGVWISLWQAGLISAIQASAKPFFVIARPAGWLADRTDYAEWQIWECLNADVQLAGKTNDPNPKQRQTVQHTKQSKQPGWCSHWTQEHE